MANTDLIPRTFKLGAINSPTDNAAITIANSGAVAFTGNVTFAVQPPLTFTNLSLGNSTVNNALTNTTIAISGASTNVTLTSSSLNVNGAVIANNSGVYTTGTVNAASHTVGTSVVANATGIYTTGSVNGAVLTVGTSFIANTTEVDITSNTLNLGTANVTSANGGYSRLPNGLIMQWGQIAANSSTAGNITFNVAHTSAVLHVSLTSANGLSANATYIPYISVVNTTVLYIRNANTASSLVNWLTIGI